MDIRRAKISDAKAVKVLLAQLGYPHPSLAQVEEKITVHLGSGYHLLVAESDGNVVGFISLHWFEFLHAVGNIGRISAFCVDEKFRSQGIGQQLLKAAEQHLLEQGCTKFEVTSNVRRERTHQFYLTNGYKEDSKRFVKYLPA